MKFGTAPRSSPAEQRNSGCGRIFGILFFGLFLSLGLLFTVLLIGDFASRLATYRWLETPCRILASEVVETEGESEPYMLEVRYEYSFGEATHTSTSIGLSPRTDSDYASLDRLRRRYQPGSGARCWVNPKRPSLSVLERRLQIVQLLFLLLPLTFVAIGAGGLIAVFSNRRSHQREAISDRARSSAAAEWVPIALGLIFVAVGGGLFVGLGLIPGMRLLAAQRWEPLPCRVIASTVRVQHSDDSTTYRIDILYEYEAMGETYRSNRYDFVTWGSSGSIAKQEVADRYPRGLETECFVDPADPSRSVLNREPRLAYLVGLAPLIFLIAGSAVLFWGGSRRRARLGAGRATRPAEPPPATAHLEARQSPLMKVFGSLIFATLWNGIVSVFVWQLISEWRHGSPNWFLALFLVPFVLVGLGTIVGVFYFLLALANPRVTLSVSPASPRLGATVRLEWRLTGAIQRLTSLKLTLEGREEATYSRGTRSHTVREVFAEHVAVETSHHVHMERGSADIHLPEDLMHSFEAAHNSVIWSLKAEGDIPRWPDVGAEFAITVRPAAVRRSS